MEHEQIPQPRKKVFRRAIEFVILNFLRLNIANKLMLGFSSLLALLVIISLYALANLNSLNSINNSIMQTDLPVIHASEEMIDLILAEELYTRRYMVYRTNDAVDAILEKKKAFIQQIERIESVPEKRKFPVAKIASLHNQYVTLLLKGTKSADTRSAAMSKESEDKIKAFQDDFIASIKAMITIAQKDQNEKAGMTAAIGSNALKAVAVLCGLGLVLSLAAATIITRNIAGAIRKLGFATEMIAKGEFDHRPDISNKDELGDLANAFTAMAGRLKHLEEMNLDTSPLTRLPGGTTIENTMNSRIGNNQKIAFCMMDIDNFKAYNDHYGYAKGNELIQATADIVSQAVTEHGSEDDFIGHIGGDDFVVISSPDRFSGICQAVVDAYDKEIPGFYNDEDRARGHIIGKNRQGDEVLFPLASISIAVVTDENRELVNHIQFGEAAAEMKEKAKARSGSVFLVDRRRDSRGNIENRKHGQLKSVS